MELKLLSQSFSVCKIPNLSQTDLSREFVFLARTDEELSLVCQTAAVPQNAWIQEDGWRGFRIIGTLDFSMVGVLANISALLAEHKIIIFAISTYNTDYIFTKADAFDQAIALLEGAGYAVAR